MRGSAPRPKPSVPAAPPEAAADFSGLGGERHVALAVSGGSDSTALMRLARDWALAHPSGPQLTVLTVDHSLRSGSAAEAETVKRWARELGLSHQTLRWEPHSKPETGIQARARKARYDLMADWCRMQGAGALVTAHTLDDQAETVLMRLSRTRSPASLAGIRPYRSWQGLPVFRPLLPVRRQALRDYLTGLGQAWLDDPSNEDPRFERVRIRQALTIPGKAEVTPERLAALAEAAGRTDALLERVSQRWISLWLVETDFGVCHVADRHFGGLPEPLQERILGRILRHYGGGGFSPEPAELRRTLNWVRRREGAPRATLAGALLGRDAAGFWVGREPSRIVTEPEWVPEGGKLVWDGRFEIEAAAGARISAAGRRPVPSASAIPAPARGAYPVVENPAGDGNTAQIRFIRLNSAQEHKYTKAVLGNIF